MPVNYSSSELMRMREQAIINAREMQRRAAIKTPAQEEGRRTQSAVQQDPAATQTQRATGAAEKNGAQRTSAAQAAHAAAQTQRAAEKNGARFTRTAPERTSSGGRVQPMPVQEQVQERVRFEKTKAGGYPDPKDIFRRNPPPCPENCPVGKAPGQSGRSGAPEDDRMMVMTLLLILIADNADKLLIFALMYIMM